MRMATWVGGFLAIVVIASPLSAAQGLSGQIYTTEPLELTGSLGGHLDDGAAHVRTDDLSTGAVNLSADSLKLSYRSEKGDGFGREGRDALVNIREPSENHTLWFTNLSMDIQPFAPPAEILAIAAGPGGEIRVDSTAQAAAEVVRNETVTDVGDRDSAQSVTGNQENEFSFSYVVDGPWVSLSQLDAATISGDFFIFVNNVTLNISTGDGERHEHWTGRERTPGSTPGTWSYEHRLTVLEVKNGTLSVELPRGVRVLGPTGDLSVDGSVHGREVSGRLFAARQGYRFDQAPLDLAGKGHAAFRAASSGGQLDGFISSSAQPRLAAEIEGALEVTPRPGVTIEQVETTDVAPTGVLTAWLPWILSLIVMIGLLVRYRDQLRLWWADRRSRHREEMINRHLRTGDRLFKNRDYAGAERCYRRIVERYPDAPEGWDSLGPCLEELERFSDAAEAYEKTSELLSGDPYLLAQAAACAWQAGDETRAVELALAAADKDQDAAVRHLTRSECRGLRARQELADLFGGGHESDASYV